MNPTLKDSGDFNAKKDADVLHKACKGFGTDEKAIISILGHRTSKQRQEIAKKYKETHGKNLADVLKSELKGDFETLCLASLRPHHENMARELNDAISGIGTKEEVISEILGVSDNQTIHRINESYKELYDTTLEKALKKDTSGCLERLYVILALGARDESQDVNESAAEEDAKKLYKEGEGSFGTDEDLFVEILTNRSRPHLRHMFKEYKKIAGHDFSKAVEKEFSGSTEKAMVTLVYALENPVKFMAYRLRDAMAGIGTNDKHLIRIVLWRSEFDMGDIKQYYIIKFGKALPDVIGSETSGDYKKMLLSLVN